MIESIFASECIDSRGFPTIRATVNLKSGVSGTAMVPSGASTGEHEALELRDGDSKRYLGKGVMKAVANANEKIAPALKGDDVFNQTAIDQKMISLDGTENKSNLGANAILSVSLACAHAAANEKRIPLFQYLGADKGIKLPVPLVNVINGGAHADNSIDFQEFMLVPHKAGTFADNIRASAEVFQNLKKILKKNKLATAVGDEGGFAPNLPSAEAALAILCDAITESGYTPGKDISLALDVAASEFFIKEKCHYVLKKSTGETLTSSEMVSLFESLKKKFPIVSIEDGVAEDDWNGWKELTTRLGATTQLVGDDLFVTNTKRLKRGIDEKCGNSILIKLNQIGTLTETLDSISMAHQAGMTSIISHRSGETEDTTIADLSVATNAGQIKTGSVCRSERVAKYNRLLWIEAYLGKRASFVSPF